MIITLNIILSLVFALFLYHKKYKTLPFFHNSEEIKRIENWKHNSLIIFLSSLFSLIIGISIFFIDKYFI